MHSVHDFRKELSWLQELSILSTGFNQRIALNLSGKISFHFPESWRFRSNLDSTYYFQVTRERLSLFYIAWQIFPSPSSFLTAFRVHSLWKVTFSCTCLNSTGIAYSSHAWISRRTFSLLWLKISLCYCFSQQLQLPTTLQPHLFVTVLSTGSYCLRLITHSGCR